MCDWNMPRMNGNELLRAVRDNPKLKNLPFLMITAEMNEATVAAAIEDEVDDYILKPFTPVTLQEKMQKILDIRAAPSPIDTHLNLGQVYLQSRQLKEAMEEFKKAYQINPKSPRVMLAIAGLYKSSGELGKATELLKQAIKLSPQFVKAHEALAEIYLAQDEISKAKSHLGTAVAIAPRNIERQMEYGKTLIKSGDTGEAKGAFKAVMQMARENHSEMARQIGEVYLEAGLEAEAQDVFLEGLAANPTDIHLHNRLGIAYRKQKKFKEAVENYEKALKIDPENENLYYNLGRAYHEAGNLEKSASAMRVAMRLYPEFEEAKLFLTKVLNK